jgi:hypothetical protein
MSKNKTKTPPDIINNVRLCDSCQNCVTLTKEKVEVKTKHFSEEEYSWNSFNEPICSLVAVQLNNVSECNKYKKNEKK